MRLAPDLDDPPRTVEARCVRLPAKAENPAALAPVVEPHKLTRKQDELLIEVRAANVDKRRVSEFNLFLSLKRVATEDKGGKAPAKSAAKKG